MVLHAALYISWYHRWQKPLQVVEHEFFAYCLVCIDVVNIISVLLDPLYSYCCTYFVLTPTVWMCEQYERERWLPVMNNWESEKSLNYSCLFVAYTTSVLQSLKSARALELPADLWSFTQLYEAEILVMTVDQLITEGWPSHISTSHHFPPSNVNCSPGCT